MYTYFYPFSLPVALGAVCMIENDVKTLPQLKTLDCIARNIQPGNNEFL